MGNRQYQKLRMCVALPSKCTNILSLYTLVLCERYGGGGAMKNTTGNWVANTKKR